MFIWNPHHALRAGRRGACCFGLALAGLAATAQIAPLSFEQALALALQENPALAASAAKTDAHGKRRSNRRFIRFAGTNAHDLLDGQDENFPIADFAGVSCFDNRIDGKG